MVRNPMDTCFSNLKEGFAGTAAYSYEQGELADFFIEYRRLIRHWHGKFPGKILDVRYEDLVTRPEETRAHVLAFCGLPQIDLAEAARIAGSITTASSAQVRGDITSKGIGAWARYAEFLQPLQMRLQTAGEYLG